MESFHLFTTQDYKTALREKVTERKKWAPSNFNFQKLAEFAGIQKTYLSKVLNGDAHLSSDQLYSCMEFLDIDPKESEYIELLHNYARSHLPKRRESLLKQIQVVQHQNLKTEAHLEAEQLPIEANLLMEYLSLIHISEPTRPY